MVPPREQEWERRKGRVRRKANTGRLAVGITKELYRVRPPPKPKSSCGARLDPVLGLRDSAFKQCLHDLPKAASALLGHQATAVETARTLALSDPRKLGGHRGLLAWHTAGSGKTITALGIALAYMQTSRFVAIVTTPANERDNNLAKYLKNLFDYKMFDVVRNGQKVQERRYLFPDGPLQVLRSTAKYARITPRQVQAWWERDFQGLKSKVGEIFSRKVKWQTYWRFSSCLGLKSNPTKECGGPGGIANAWKTRGMAVILDEAHALVSPGKGENPELSRKLYEFFDEHSQNPKLHLYCLTATPGDSPAAWAKLLSLVRRVGQPKFTADLTYANTEALLSYRNMSKNARLLARNVAVPARDIAMDPRYFVSLLQVLVGLQASQSSAKQLSHDPPEDFISRIRAASLVLGSSARQWLSKGAWTPEGGESVNVSSFKNLTASAKMVAVMNNVDALARARPGKPGKQYLYLPEDGVPRVASVAVELLKKRGWTDVTEGVLSGRFDLRSPSSVGKNFVVFRATGRSENDLARIREAFNGLVPASGSTSRKLEFEEYDTQTAARNLHGQRIGLVICTGTYYQGVDLKALRAVHLPTPFPTRKQETQATGRGRRAGAHQFMNEADRDVTVYRYRDVLPPQLTRSVVLESLPPKKKKLVEEVARALNWMDVEAGGSAGGEALRSFNSLLQRKASGGLAKGEKNPLNAFENRMRNAAVDCAALKQLHPGARCKDVSPVRPNSVIARSMVKKAFDKAVKENEERTNKFYANKRRELIERNVGMGWLGKSALKYLN